VSKIKFLRNHQNFMEKSPIMAHFEANRLAVLIGSLPVATHEEGIRMVFEYTRDIPLWVQLPAYPQEGMMVQFSPGIPGIVQHEDRVFIDTTGPAFEDDLLRFYEDYLTVTEGGAPLDGTRFALTQETAKGFFTLLDVMKSPRRRPMALKGQITGPVTLATGLTDQDKRAVFYDHRLLDVVVKTLAMKARWQVEKLSQWGLPVMIFVDEPGLAGFGTSAFISISEADIGAVLSEVIDAVHQAGGLAGVHVCANTDWSLILKSSADILSFDAYSFFDRLALYNGLLHNFFEQGRTLAWGIVPTSSSEDINRETASTLVKKWEAQVSHLETLGINRTRILAQSLISPSCGAGSLAPSDAIKVLEMTREVSQTLRAQG
jgi:methionine synthase II (cobalamin-independent)